MLLVVGSDDSDTLVLTSPLAENVWKYLGFSRWSGKQEHYGFMLQAMERDNSFVALTCRCTAVSLHKDWHKTVHLRKRDTVLEQIYVLDIRYRWDSTIKQGVIWIDDNIMSN